MPLFEKKAKANAENEKESPFAKAPEALQSTEQGEGSDVVRGQRLSASSGGTTGALETATDAAAVMKYYADHPGGQTSDAHSAGKQGLKNTPKIIELNSEKVLVNSAEEERQASEIIAELKDKYGVEVSSTTGLGAIKREYDEVTKEVTDKLQTKCWEMKELIALRKALQHFAPILGRNRQTSSRRDVAQEVTSVSKIDQAIDTNAPTGKLEHNTNGEYFKKSQNFAMFSAGTTMVSDFAMDRRNNDKDLEGLAVHELAHGLFANNLESFIAASGYWKSQFRVGTMLEFPITDYAKRNADEDLSETVKYYFMDPGMLQDKCPRRFQFVKEVVENWQPKAEGSVPNKAGLAH